MAPIIPAAYGPPSSYVGPSANLRRYADVISQAAPSLSDPITEYSNPNFARLASILIGAGFEGGARRKAARLDERKRLESANLTRSIVGLPTTAVSMPEPTGFLSGLDRTLGFGAAPSTAAPLMPSTVNDDGSTNYDAIIRQAMDAGIDPTAAVSTSLAYQKTRAGATAATLAATQAKAIRTMRMLQLKRRGVPEGNLSEEDQKLWDATVPNLPADISKLNTRVAITENGKTVGFKSVDIFGRDVGDEKFAPKPGVSIITEVLSSEAQGVGKIRASKLATIETAADQATQNLEIINQVLNIYARAEAARDEGEALGLTGPGKENLLNIKSSVIAVASAFGFKPSELGIDMDEITDQQTLRTALNQMVLERTKLLKGAISEKELVFSGLATANFGNTPEANAIVLLFQKRAALRAEKLAEFAHEYYDTFGTFGGTKDKKFYDKKYKSFREFQNEYRKEDAVIGVGMIEEIDSREQLAAYMKLRGGSEKLSEEEVDAISARITALTPSVGN
jgi:hypothetical protein